LPSELITIQLRCTTIASAGTLSFSSMVPQEVRIASREDRVEWRLDFVRLSWPAVPGSEVDVKLGESSDKNSKPLTRTSESQQLIVHFGHHEKI